MFLRDRWYAAALSEELAGKPLARTILGEPVVLFRTEDGAVIALEDRCVHRQAPLSLGTVIGDTLRCGYHGLTFDRTGACVRVPGQRTIPPGARVRAYPAVERQGFAFIWMGDPAEADPATIYDFPYATRAGWRALYARLYAKCNYRLLIDNLMDLSHLAFAHATTIGSMGVAENVDMKVERDSDRVRVTRWMLDIAPAPAHVLATNDTRNVDRWQTIEFTPPGYVWLAVGSAVADTGIRDGRRDGVLLDRHSLHLITPETQATAHYFWVMTNDAAQVDRTQERILYEQSLKAFNEDLTIIEGQQQRLDSGRPTVDVNADAGVLQVRRVFDRLLDAQNVA